MLSITRQVPETAGIDKQKAKILLVTKLYAQGKLSLGQAAEMVGYTKRTFMELLGWYHVPFFNYDPSELENDMKNAARYRRHQLFNSIEKNRFPPSASKPF